MTIPDADAQNSMIELVRGLEAGTVTPSAAKPAATVMLVRDRDGGPQVYLLRRVQTMAFAAGMTVFPGGSVDSRDSELPAEVFVGADLDAWGPSLGADRSLTAALACAAVRETFEESGVMLAGAHADDVVADTSGDDWEIDRLALLDRSLSLGAMLTRRGLVLRADLLMPWAHWITPDVEPRRYDTRFFVAAIPDGQRTRDVGGEADRVSWQRPADALAAADRGEVGILPPTASALRDLSAFESVAEILEAGRSREVRTVRPRLTVEDGRLRFHLPEHVDPGGANPWGG